MSWFIVSIPKAEHERKVFNNTNNRKDNKVNGNINQIKIPERYIIRIPEDGTIGRAKTVDHGDSMEKTLSETLKKLEITDAVWSSDEKSSFIQVTFPSEPGLDNDRILRTLVDKGIGIKGGSTIGIVPCTVYYKDDGSDDESPDEESNASLDSIKEEKKNISGFKALQKDFLKTVTARLTVAQVVEQVRNDGASMSFDFLLFAMCASMVAALGLMENSTVNIVASMLISPIMGPILAVTFGIMIRDRKLICDGIKMEICGLSLCITTGFIFGVICGNYKWTTGYLPSPEQIGRGQYRSLWVGTLVALPSGAGVALSVLGGNHASLVGVAISASLLPPAVNCGLLWGLSVLKYAKSRSDDFINVTVTYPLTNTIESLDLRESLYDKDFQFLYNPSLDKEYACLAIFSLLLTAVNIACIIVAAVVVLKVKEVAPYTSIPKTERFWKEDVKIARDYNKTMGAQEGNVLGARMLQEWAKLTGLDPKEVLGNSEEARKAQIQTLKDIVQDVEDDEVYKTVMKNMSASPGSLESRLKLDSMANGQTNTPVWALDYGGTENRPPETRRFSFLPGQERRRKLSKSPNSFVIQGVTDDPSIIGMETQELPPAAQRSRMLRRSLAQVDNPYTLWPTQNPRRMSVTNETVSSLRSNRRVSIVPRFVVTPVSENQAVSRRRSRVVSTDTDVTQL